MNLSHSSKTMTMLTLIRQQQETSSVTPLNSEDEDDSSTIQNNFSEKKSTIANDNHSDQHDHQSDLYTPLSYDEADEGQLAEFFTTLDIDVSFSLCSNVIDNMYEVPLQTERQSAKRRRLPNSGDSLSSSFSEETYDYDGTGLQRKQDHCGTDSNLDVAPIE